MKLLMIYAHDREGVAEVYAVAGRLPGKYRIAWKLASQFSGVEADACFAPDCPEITEQYSAAGKAAFIFADLVSVEPPKKKKGKKSAKPIDEQEWPGVELEVPAINGDSDA